MHLKRKQEKFFHQKQKLMSHLQQDMSLQAQETTRDELHKEVEEAQESSVDEEEDKQEGTPGKKRKFLTIESRWTSPEITFLVLPSGETTTKVRSTRFPNTSTGVGMRRMQDHIQTNESRCLKSTLPTLTIEIMLDTKSRTDQVQMLGCNVFVTLSAVEVRKT